MLVLLMSSATRYGTNTYLADWGRRLPFELRVITYEELFRRRRIPLASYIFAGLERLPPAGMEQAGRVWQALASSGHPLHLLNSPLQVMHRYELLRTLHERGSNDFDVYRLTEARSPRRYPLFVRGENDHDGPESPLLHSPDELNTWIKALTAAGHSRETRLITEFNAVPDARGLYKKYGAFNIGGRILPRHVLFGRDWIVKSQFKMADAATLAEEQQYVDDNPHEAQLREIFTLARIDYGRIDYGLVAGRVQVYEINTDPSLATPGPSQIAARTANKARFNEAFIAALAALDSPAQGELAIPCAQPPLWRRRPPLIDLILALNRRLPGLRRYEPVLHLHLMALKRRLGRSG